MPAPVARFEILLENMNQCNGVLIGPGLGRSRKTDVRTCHLVERLQTPLVLDADGINAVAEHIDVLDTRRGRLTVLTPHDGEFLRLRQGKAIGPDREARCFGVCPSARLRVGAEGAPNHHRLSRWGDL